MGLNCIFYVTYLKHLNYINSCLSTLHCAWYPLLLEAGLESSWRINLHPLLDNLYCCCMRQLHCSLSDVWFLWSKPKSRCPVGFPLRWHPEGRWQVTTAFCVTLGGCGKITIGWSSVGLPCCGLLAENHWYICMPHVCEAQAVHRKADIRLLPSTNKLFLLCLNRTWETVKRTTKKAQSADGTSGKSLYKGI